MIFYEHNFPFASHDHSIIENQILQLRNTSGIMIPIASEIPFSLTQIETSENTNITTETP